MLFDLPIFITIQKSIEMDPCFGLHGTIYYHGCFLLMQLISFLDDEMS